MSKIVEKNAAELIMIALLVIVLLSSCGTSKQYHIGTGEPMKKACNGAWVR